MNKETEFFEFSVLDFLLESDRQSLLKSARSIYIEKGQVVRRRDNELPDQLYILLRGRLTLRSKIFSRAEVGQILPGRSVELRTLFLGGKNWDSVWTAEEASALLSSHGKNFCRPYRKIPPRTDTSRGSPRPRSCNGFRETCGRFRVTRRPFAKLYPS